jgi:2-C-methyl-D-erythritol 2,4-cyclodiphosphate synthase
MSDVRVGWGFDAHRFGGEPPLLLGGVEASSERGVEATSDGDIVAHAVIDALLGSAALGDLGTLFPSDDPIWHGADSFHMLDLTLSELAAHGLRPTFIDVTVIAQSVRVGPIREEIRINLAAGLGLDASAISVKATTTDRMGWIGADEGIAAAATATVTVFDRDQLTPEDTGLLGVLGATRRPRDPDWQAWYESLNAESSSRDPVRWAAALRDIHHVRHIDGISPALTAMLRSLRSRLVPLVARQLAIDLETAEAAIERALSQSEPPLD